MIKKDKNYRKLNLKQSKLKSTLHTNIRIYYSYRVKQTKTNDGKAPITLSELTEQENIINNIRKQLKKIQITLVKDLKSTLIHLK